MRFRYEYLSLTEVGEVFGVSNQQVGKWLADLGLRYHNQRGWWPTQKARESYVKDVGTLGHMYVWHAERTIKELEGAGHQVAIPPGHALLAPCRLNGPFQFRPSAQFGHEVVNGDGTVAVCVAGKDNARFLTDLLNLAHRHGVVDRVPGHASNAS
jgi:hypothetical protein